VFTTNKKPVEAKETAPMAQEEPHKEGELDIAGYVSETAATIENDTIREKVETLTKAKNYEELVNTFAKLDKPLAVTYYLRKKAETVNTIPDWVGLGDFTMMLMQTAPDDKARNYLSTTAIESYSNAVALDSTITDNRLRLASAYMENGTQPMQGVGILLDIVRKDSTNVDALLLLGRFGIVSGQYDKAIARLEKILYLQPQNSEALLMMAEAHNNLGNKEKALELLERCKKTVSDPELKREIDKYIQSIKKPS
jgi:tetratricopeptide (TPR) repeat protein